MARYRKIHVTMYADARYRALSRPQPNAQSLWTYLLTGPHTTALPGLSTIGEAAMAEALGWPLKDFREAFREVLAKGMAKADWEARVVWIPNAIRYNPPESPNVVTSWAKVWEEIPECALKVVAFSTLKDFVEDLPEGFRKAFAKAFPKGCPNQEQEQEQEQESLSAGADATANPDKADTAKQPRAANAGKAGAAKVVRKRQDKADEKPEHADLRTYFCERWKGRNDGADYAWKFGRDDAHAKWILDQVGRSAAKAKAVVDAFMKDEDPWLAERGHEIALLVSRFNRYRSKGPIVSESGFVRAERTDAEYDDLLRGVAP